MEKQPDLSVIMGVYNAAPFLAETLDNILAQSMADFELVCADDASTDGSLAVLESYAAKDKRIRIVRLPENKGVGNALNAAVAQTCGKYIAIADADDLYLPHRFEKQTAFLDAHPEYVAVGSSILFMDQGGTVFYHEPMPERDVALRWRMMFDSPHPHAATMVRASAYKTLQGPYRTDLRAAADYDMWTRLLALGKGHNLKDPMILYRQRQGSISQARREEQMRNRDAVCAKQLKKRIGDHGLSREEIARLRHLFFNGFHKKIENPEAQDVENLFHCFRLYVKGMTREEAVRFLYEEQAFLGEAYLSAIGLGDLSFVAALEER